MRKVFLDLGVREGDAIAAFLGDRQVGGGAYYNCLLQREDAQSYEFYGFEAPTYIGVSQTKDRFAHVDFTLIDRLAWVYDGEVIFDSDGSSLDCRLLEVSRTEEREPWRHPNPQATLQMTPCVDIADFVEKKFSKDDYLILKVDIEGAEYEVLNWIIQRGLMSWFKELYIEYHWWGSVSLRQSIEACIRMIPGVHYRNDWP